MDYAREFEYSMYTLRKMEEQSAMEHFVKECFILANESSSIADLKALNEASGFGERVKEAWEKFKAFIKKLWGKFINNMDKFFLKDVDYLKKHKDIILNKPMKREITMQDYHNGTINIGKTGVPALSEQMLDGGDLASKEAFVKKLNIPGVTSSENDAFKTECKNYFLGGPEMKAYSGSDINMTDLYNYCIDYKNKTSVILKNQEEAFNSSTNAINNKINKLEKEKAEANKATEQKSEENKNNTQDTAADSTKSQETNTQGQGTGSGETPKTGDASGPESFWFGGNLSAYSEVYNAYITEDGEQKMTIGKAGDGPATSGGESKRLSANIVAKKGEDINDDQMKNAVDKQKIEDLNNKIGVYRDVCGMVFASKITAAEQIYKDYMKIIRAHVSDYAGEEDKEKSRTATAETDYRSELQKVISANETELIKAAEGKNPNNENDVNAVRNKLEELSRKANLVMDRVLEFLTPTAKRIIIDANQTAQ